MTKTKKGGKKRKKYYNFISLFVIACCSGSVFPYLQLPGNEKRSTVRRREF